MLIELIKFEWHAQSRKWSFYATILVFFMIGFLITAVANTNIPNINKNSPYMLTYLISLLSLMSIFSTTLNAAQNLLKEQETKFYTIIYATPIRKFAYLFSRFLVFFGVSVLFFSMTVLGLILGYQMPYIKGEMGIFSLWNYFYPFFVLAIPNIFLCVAILCALAWTTKNKLIIYVGGLLIYVLYILASVFVKSPLIGNISPATATEIAFAAKLDPFGLATFFEQTQHWTAHQRNTQLISFEDNFLINRVLWFIIPVFLLVASYFSFSFENIGKKSYSKNKKEENSSKKSIEKITKTALQYQPVLVEIHTNKHNWATFCSFIKLDLYVIFREIPLILIVLIWTVLFGIELVSEINGGVRISAYFASSALIMKVLDVISFFALIVILFYSNEILWRSRNVGINTIENTTPISSLMMFFAKLFSLSMIPLILILYSFLIGFAFQIVYDYPKIEITLYLSMLYFIGMPLVLSVAIILAIQVITNNKYLGLTLAGVFILLTNSPIGRMIGIRHTLFRFANSYLPNYADMNGFGAYTFPFHLKMLYSASLVLILIIIASKFWNKEFQTKWKINQKIALIACVASFLITGSFIFYQTNIKKTSQTPTERNDLAYLYEKSYKIYENMPQPTITDVTTNVDLFPSESSYNVQGSYILVNKTTVLIDSILIYIDENTQLKNLRILDKNNKEIAGTKSLQNANFGHYWYILNEKLAPKDSLKMLFNFSSAWSPFQKHISFNSILKNGSFMRMSRYFPSFGYQTDNEIADLEERKQRQMKPQTALKKLEDTTNKHLPYDYQFINFEAIVSTENDQTAISIGELQRKWTENNRNFFHYKTSAPVPFRFAFSSAKYNTKTTVHNNINIEVYFDARHPENVPSLLSDAKNSLDYLENNFGKYPYKTIRFVEISDFVSGFAATAYPTTIFMNERLGFRVNMTENNGKDGNNEFTGHELSHQWWGNAQISPQMREGSIILTETLAMYSELMIYQKRYGKKSMQKVIEMHQNLYLDQRAFSKERPLYKAHNEDAHIAYNKGAVVMYKLQEMIGENNVNKALKALLYNFSYPKNPPTSQDLLNEIYKVSPENKISEIKKMFTEVEE